MYFPQFCVPFTKNNYQKAQPNMQRRQFMPKGTTLTSKGPLIYDRLIGKGQFGKAHSMRDQRGTMFCIKEVSVRTSDEHQRTLVLNEVHIMRETCKHPNIIMFYESWFQTNRLCILMEYCRGGSLDKLIYRFITEGKTFTHHKIMHYMQEIAGALRYCHTDLHIMHRDLKPANILIDDIGTLKLADFGLARTLSATEFCATFCGSPQYMSPEQFAGNSYSFSADVWSLGCILYELMTLKSPWFSPGTSIPTLISRIRDANPSFDGPRLVYPICLIDLTRWMLQKNPSKRASALQIEQHFDMRALPALDTSILSPMDIHPIANNPNTYLAANCIQRSFRISLERRRIQKECPDFAPPPVPLSPMDRDVNHVGKKIGSFDKKQNSAAYIQQQFRTSIGRKVPTPVAPLQPYNFPPALRATGDPQHASSRIEILAQPKPSNRYGGRPFRPTSYLPPTGRRQSPQFGVRPAWL